MKIPFPALFFVRLGENNNTGLNYHEKYDIIATNWTHRICGLKIAKKEGVQWR